MSIMTNSQKYIDHDAILPKVVPKPIENEIKRGERKNKNQETISIFHGEQKEMADLKKKDANQRNLELQTLKHEVDQELDEFPIILDGD